MNWPPRILGPVVVEQDRRDVVVDGQPLPVVGGQVVGIGCPGPRLDGGRVGRGRGGQLGRGQPRRPGRAQPLEQPELDAEIDEPGAMEPAKAGDQVVVPVVVAHRRDCRTPRIVPFGDATVTARCRVQEADGHRRPWA